MAPAVTESFEKHKKKRPATLMIKRFTVSLPPPSRRGSATFWFGKQEAKIH
jgi:hypothetical protein